jgi:hypothetical protein
MKPGDSVLLRTVIQGRARHALPLTLVEEGSRHVAMYCAPGTRYVCPTTSIREANLDELAHAVELGLFSAADAAAAYTVAESVVAAGAWPTGSGDWRPDPSWALPKLPEDWDVV